VRIYFTTIGLVWLLFLAGCTLDRVQGSNNEVVTEDMLQQAAQILGSTVSSSGGGVLLSVSDALALMSENGYNGNSGSPGAAKNLTDRVSNRSSVYNLQMGYNEKTGFYIVTFMRYGDNEKSQESDTLRYIFRDLEGEKIIYPREQFNQIENIRYSGVKHGQVYGRTEQSFYERHNEFFISELLSDTTAHTYPLEGGHSGIGAILTRAPNQEIPDSMFYKVSYDFLNVVIQGKKGLKNMISSFDLAGTAHFQYSVWEHNIAKPPQEPQITGTITFNNDGTALYKLEQSSERILVNLQDGKVLSTQ
jgi:hypothetical protein